MLIEPELKLDFSDVLIRPKRSTLSSRKDVDLTRTFKFKHSNQTWTGIPIMAANMDGVGTVAMATALEHQKMFTCLTKHISSNDITNGWLNPNHYAISTGTNPHDFNYLKDALTNNPGANFICIDVANGYSEHFGDFVAKVRNKYPDAIIIAGNVVTADMTQELILRGADIVKVGIGQGCFVAGTKITTHNGEKNIEDIKVGDIVLTHTLSWKPVTDTFIHTHHKKIITINDTVTTTPNHEFYVVHKKYLGLLHDENIEEYAIWISAAELNENYMLIEINEGKEYKMLTKFKLTEIKSITENVNTDLVYDFEVKDDHSYVANNIVVHNSACTTRIQTGVGYPQLAAVIECADAAHGLGAHIISDGGCTCPGDIAKAFGAGADFVMLGGMLAGCDEGGGKVITRRYETNEIGKGQSITGNLKDVYIVEEKQFVQFYGMSSQTAMDKHHGGVAEYRSSEGRTVEVSYKGSVEDVVKDILGGLRSTCSYVGASELKHLSKCTTFIRVSNQYNKVFVK